MADGTTQGGSAIVSGDEVTTENGTGVTARQAQRVKVDAVGADGAFRDTSGVYPLPVALTGRNPTYRLFIPKAAVGANKVFFDLFNATGSGKTLRVLSIIPIVSGEVAVTGVIAFDLFLTRTTAVGTTGTAATNDGTSLTAATFTRMNPNDAVLPATVTARLAPGGGATAGAVLGTVSLFSEETNAGTYLSALNDLAGRSAGAIGPELVVTENTGLRVVQGAVASVGNVGFDVIFEAI